MIARIAVLILLAVMFLPQQASAGGLKLKSLFKLSVEDENRIGAKMLEDFRKEPGVFAPDSQDRHNRIVQDIGSKLVSMNQTGMADAEFEFQFFLIKDKTVNAFATPGGYIYVTQGLMDVMAYDQSMVAAVMAHEIGHVLERHVAEGYEKAMQGAAGLTVLGVLFGKKNRDALNLLESVGGVVYLKFNRDQEEESDRYGVQLSYNAGYDPFGMMRSLECLESLYGSADDMGEWMQDHPSTEGRVKRTEYIARESSGHENGYWPIPSPKDKEHPLYEKYGTPASAGEVTKSTNPVKSTSNSGSASNIRFKGEVGIDHRHEIWRVEDENPGPGNMGEGQEANPQPGNEEAGTDLTPPRRAG